MIVATDVLIASNASSLQRSLVSAYEERSALCINQEYTKRDHLDLSSDDPLLKTRPPYHREPHRLDAGRCLIIRVHPVRATHQHQTVDNRVQPLVDVAVPPFFKGPDAVSPQGIVKVDFVERIFVPINSIESTIGPTPSGTVVQRPTDYLKRLWLVCTKRQTFRKAYLVIHRICSSHYPCSASLMVASV